MRAPEGSRFERSRSAIRGAGTMMSLSLSLLLVACRNEATSEAKLPQTSKSPSVERAAPSGQTRDVPLVVFLGDSLTAGYG
ncbi:MAG: hypothetical protein ACREQQ_00370, partial [Candidatus Binatia bacterium]